MNAKKIFTTLCIALIGSSVASAVSMPEKLYLMGSPTDWTFPNASESDYVLTDDDGDGIYTGEFEIYNNFLSFFILTETVETWDDMDAKGCAYGLPYGKNSIRLFNDGPKTLDLIPNGSSMEISNWVGGTLKIAAKVEAVDDALNIRVSLDGTNQPSANELPSALYVVGNINDWILPTVDGGPDPYVLTNTLGTSDYEGEFEFAPGELQFKLIPGRSGWSAALGLITNDKNDLYSNRPYAVDLYGGYDRGDIIISNWQGGTIKMHVAYDNEENTAKLTLSAPGQPKAMALPDVIYVIGEFNEWQLPTEESDNGALSLALDKEKYDSYGDVNFASHNFDLPAGDQEFCFFYRDPETARSNYVGANVPNRGMDPIPFTLYNYTGEDHEVSYWWEIKRSSAKRGIHTLLLKDWEGGMVNFSYLFDNENAGINAVSPKYRTLPAYDIFAQTPDATMRENINPAIPYAYSSYNGYKQISVFVALKDGDSYDLSTENIYGIPTDEIISSQTNATYPLVKGGYPLNFKFPAAGYISVSYNLENSLVSAYAVPGTDFSDVDQLFICGNLSGWMIPSESNRELYEEKYQLTKVAPGVFEGMFDMPADDSDPEYPANTQFRFFVGLAGWTPDCSVGSVPEDFYCQHVIWNNCEYSSELCLQGLGNWGLKDWPGGPVWIRVDFNNKTLHLADNEQSEIKAVYVAPTQDTPEYYNLHGQRVANPTPGIYVVYRNGKATKQVIR